MKIAIGSDHAGFNLKTALRDLLRKEGYVVEDCGTDSTESSDYPDYAEKVCRAVINASVDLGVLCCGTGVGISIAANKVRGIRAAAVSEPVSARLARSHNDANVVCIGERIVGTETAVDIVKTFLQTPFSNGERHKRRIDKIYALESAECADPVRLATDGAES